MSDPCDLSLTAVLDLIATRAISAVELTRACLDRVAESDVAIGAFTHVEPEFALAAARRADAALARGEPTGPLHGVPVARKDNIGRAGQRLTAGSRVFANRLARETATALATLDAAGGIDLGATSLSEFAFHVNGASSLAPPPRNPWNPNRIAGGSSGGSAAALAARFVFGALGTDSGGSIRSPASLCGIVGLMPTRGLIDRSGMAIGSETVDVIGPMARTVADCARLLAVLAPGSNAESALLAPLRGRRIRVLVDDHPLPDATRAAINAATAVFADLGAAVEAVRWIDHDEINRHASNVFVSEVAHALASVLDAHRGDIHPEIVMRLEAGLAMPEAVRRESIALAGAFTRDFAETVLGPADALLLPAAPTAAPRHEDVIQATSIPVHGASNTIDPGRYTRAFNYLGLPGLVVPGGFDEAGLPVGLQLVGRAGADDQLLNLGHQFQCATLWHNRRPPIPILPGDPPH